MIYQFLIGKRIENVNKQLGDKLHQPVIKKFKRRKFYPTLKENIWAVDSAKME